MGRIANFPVKCFFGFSLSFLRGGVWGGRGSGTGWSPYGSSHLVLVSAGHFLQGFFIITGVSPCTKGGDNFQKANARYKHSGVVAGQSVVGGNRDAR